MQAQARAHAGYRQPCGMRATVNAACTRQHSSRGGERQQQEGPCQPLRDLQGQQQQEGGASQQCVAAAAAATRAREQRRRRMRRRACACPPACARGWAMPRPPGASASAHLHFGVAALAMTVMIFGSVGRAAVSQFCSTSACFGRGEGAGGGGLGWAAAMAVPAAARHAVNPTRGQAQQSTGSISCELASRSGAADAK